MHAIAQCFAVGVGAAFGLAAVFALISSLGRRNENRNHVEYMALHHRIEDRMVRQADALERCADALEKIAEEKP